MDVLRNWTLADVQQRVAAQAHAHAARTFVVGIAGPPAAGKSTLAVSLVNSINSAIRAEVAGFCPMDGFHFSNARLEELYLKSAKGRIDTFDVDALAAMLVRIQHGERGFYWPAYSRVCHDVVPDGSFISSEMRIFVVEGNYLLAPIEKWKNIGELLDLKIFIHEDDVTTTNRLLSRHRLGGKTEEHARSKVANVDLPNAEMVRQTERYADIVLVGRDTADWLAHTVDSSECPHSEAARTN